LTSGRLSAPAKDQTWFGQGKRDDRLDVERVPKAVVLGAKPEIEIVYGVLQLLGQITAAVLSGAHARKAEEGHGESEPDTHARTVREGRSKRNAGAHSTPTRIVVYKR
jgi:hypothetical protein